MKRAADGAIWNPATQRAQQKAQQRRIAVVVLVCAVAAGALLGAGHAEEPFLARPLGYCDGARYLSDCVFPWWLHWAVGASVAGLFAALLAPLVLWAPRRVFAPISCRVCGGAGWPEDLATTEGRCPRCAADRFDCHEVALGRVPVGGSVAFFPYRAHTTDVSGRALLAKWQARRRT